MLKPYLAQAMNRENLSAQQAEEAMQVIMTGQATEAQVGGYLVAMRMKGETVEEIAGSARAMRDHAARIPFSSNGHDLLDTAGTLYAVELRSNTVSSSVLDESGGHVSGFDVYDQNTLIGYRDLGAELELVRIDPAAGTVTPLATLAIDTVKDIHVAAQRGQVYLEDLQGGIYTYALPW